METRLLHVQGGCVVERWCLGIDSYNSYKQQLWAVETRPCTIWFLSTTLRQCHNALFLIWPGHFCDVYVTADLDFDWSSFVAIWDPTTALHCMHMQLEFYGDIVLTFVYVHDIDLNSINIYFS